MIEDTKAERVTRTGEKSATVEHDDGSKFEVNFSKEYPEKLKGNPKPPSAGNAFRMGASFDKEGRVIRESCRQ